MLLTAAGLAMLGFLLIGTAAWLPGGGEKLWAYVRAVASTSGAALTIASGMLFLETGLWRPFGEPEAARGIALILLLKLLGRLGPVITGVGFIVLGWFFASVAYAQWRLVRRGDYRGIAAP